MRSKIIKRNTSTKKFVQGDILEYVTDNEALKDIKIVIMFIKEQSSTTFKGVCLHAENTPGWTVGEISDCVNYSCFKLFDGTLEISN